MAVFYKCDGCLCAIDDEPVQFGLVKKGHYCPKCAEFVKEFYVARDVLHTKLAKQWQSGLDKIKKAFHKDCPEGKLPDEA